MKRNEKGFTLIELLIVIAILGVLAGVAIPNVSRFIGAGKSEAAQTELATVSSATQAMMVDKGISTIDGTLAVSTGNMSAFPSSTRSLYPLYMQTEITSCNYSVTANGTVTQTWRP